MGKLSFLKANFVAHGQKMQIFLYHRRIYGSGKNDDDWDLVFPDYELAGKEIYNRD